MCSAVSSHRLAGPEKGRRRHGDYIFPYEEIYDSQGIGDDITYDDEPVPFPGKRTIGHQGVGEEATKLTRRWSSLGSAIQDEGSEHPP